jgi:hypothetical protein
MSIDSWSSGTSGDWTLASGWSLGNPPAATDTAVLAAPGSYAVTLFGAASVAGLTLAAAGAEFYDAGSLAFSGTVALQSGTLALAYGTLSGGTLSMAGGQLLSSGGTLDGMAVQGTLTLAAPQSVLFVRDGLSLSGLGGVGVGSIALTGAYAALDFLGSQTLANATISLGSAGAQPGQTGPATLAITHAGGATSGATLTLASTLWLRQSGGAGVSGIIAVGSTGGLPGGGLPDRLVNQGTITAGTSGATLEIAGSGSFVNQGTLAVSNGATLDIATAGFANTGVIAVSSATLALGGTFSAALLSGLGNLVLSASQVAIAGTADDTGGTLSLGVGSTLGASLGQVSLAGTILNGTVVDGGGGLSFASGVGVLDGTNYVGTLNLSAPGQAVTLTDGARVSAAGVGAGTVLDTGAGSALLLRGTETLDNAMILLGSASPTAASIATTDLFLASTGTTATLGPNLVVQQVGATAALQANGWSPLPGVGAADTLVNRGSILGTVAGGGLSISGYGTFINQGAITIAGGDTLSVTVSQFANAGSLTVGAGGAVFLGQQAGFYGTSPVWSNTGRIIVGGGTLTLGGAMATSQLGSITETSGSVQLAGTLSNAGATLALGTTGQALNLPSLSLAGTILGGTVADSAGMLAIGSSGAALLDGVSYAGTLALTAAGAFLRVRDGLAVTGVADIVGAGSVLDFQGSQTIDHAQIMLGSANAAAAIDLLHDFGTSGGSTLALGGSLNIVQSGALAVIGRPGGVVGDAIVNAGTITAGVAAGTLTLGGPSFVNRGRIAVSNGETLAITAGGFTNTGSITVSGGVLSLAGSLTLAGLGQVSLSGGVLSEAGVLDLAGGTLLIGLGSAIGRLGLTGTLKNGTIADSGGGLAAIGGATLDNVTYSGVLDLSRPFSQLAIADGLTMAPQAGGGLGSILLTGAQARLVATTSETLDHVAITLGSVSQYYQGQHIPPPELDAAAGTRLALGAASTLTLSGTAGVLGDAALGQWTDSIANAGQIIAATPGVLTLGGSFFTNTGTIAVSGGGIVSVSNTGFVNSGAMSIGAGSAIQVTLYNAYAAPNAGASVFTNAGTITIDGGTLQELTANGLFPALPLVNLPGASIQGFGRIAAEIANSGTIEARAGTLVLTQPTIGAGTTLIDPGATLELATAEPAGQIARFASTGGTLTLDQLSAFAGTIGNFVAGDVIDLPAQILTGVGISSGTLVVSTATQNTRLATTMPLGGALSAGRDVHGNATVSITPQTIGNGSAVATLSVGQPRMLFWASPVGDVFQGITANIAGAHITNWSATDSIDLSDLLPSTARLTEVQTANLDTLTISDGVHTASIGLTGTFSATGFHLAADGHGGTMLSYGV